MSAIAIGSALVVGLVGQVHCVGMCGGIAAVACGRPAAGAGVRRSALVHAGRIGAYAGQGALLGGAAGWLASSAPFEDAQLLVRLVAALLLVLAGLHISGVTSLSASLGRWLERPLARAHGWLGAPSAGSGGELLRGVGWGLLPCGLVQGALALALAAGSAPLGALVMAAFGVGTLPVLVALSLVARSVLGGVGHAVLRRAAGLLIVVSGAAHLSMVAIDAGVLSLGAETPRPCCAGKAP